jgi:hypothetical protein
LLDASSLLLRQNNTRDELAGIYFWKKTTNDKCSSSLQHNPEGREMFLAEAAEKMGLFDFLAPRKDKSRKTSEGSLDKEKLSRSSQSDGLPLDPPELDPQAYQTQEELQKQSILQGQRARELKAAKRGFFVKNQRVKYYHQAKERWIEDVTVAGVHLDDGPDKPYYVRNYLLMPWVSIYLCRQFQSNRLRRIDILTLFFALIIQTIKYKQINSDGTREDMEKQTTSNRLEFVEFDAEKSWSILNR